MRTAISALVLTAALLAAGGCKSTSSSAASGSGGTTSGGGKPAAASNLDAHLPKTTNICALLPPATVAQLTGTAFSDGKEDDTASYEIFSCDYTSSSVLGAQLDVDVLGLDAAPGYNADVDTYKQVGSKITQIAGLGDKAFSTSIAGGAVGHVDALYGNVMIKLSGLSTLSEDQAKQVITQLHGKLSA